MNDCGDLFKDKLFLFRFIAWICCAVALAIGLVSKETGPNVTLPKIPSMRGFTDPKDMQKDMLDQFKQQTGGLQLAYGLANVCSFIFFFGLLANLIIALFADLDRYTDLMLLGVGACMGLAAGLVLGCECSNASECPGEAIGIGLLLTTAGVLLLLATLLYAKDFGELGDLFCPSRTSWSTLFTIIALFIQLLNVLLKATNAVPLTSNAGRLLIKLCPAFLPLALFINALVVASYIFPDDEPDEFTLAVYMFTAGAADVLDFIGLAVLYGFHGSAIVWIALAAGAGGFLIAAGVLLLL